MSRIHEMDGSGIPEAPHSSRWVRPFSTTGSWAGQDVIRGKPEGKSVSARKERQCHRQRKASAFIDPFRWTSNGRQATNQFSYQVKRSLRIFHRQQYVHHPSYLSNLSSPSSPIHKVRPFASDSRRYDAGQAHRSTWSARPSLVWLESSTFYSLQDHTDRLCTVRQ